MRLVFAGTPEFARVALEHLQDAGHEIVLVLTQPDRPAGRGLKLQASSVKQHALTHGLALAQPHSLRLDGKYPQDALNAREALVAAKADVVVVVAYGLLLPQWVLDLMSGGAAQLGCLNIHASLLPRWRGAAPIQRAIEAGDSETGVTIMQMDAGLDTGAMLLRESLPIVQQGVNADTSASLHHRLAQLGARLIVQALAEIQGLKPVPQGAVGVCYAHKIEKPEALIDWCQSAELIVRRVRAFNPQPGAFTSLGGEILKIWAATVSATVTSAAPNFTTGAAAQAGEILAVGSDGILVAALDSVLCITELQRAGGKRLPLAEFLRGFPLVAGQRFDLAVDH